ncbi:Transglutaminase-like domain protein [Candidatus Magnetomorum sp. HK-1]|nr:Transglutaminase-like domain protein [Candidatus Magnetomorum sp. HK-1]
MALTYKKSRWPYVGFCIFGAIFISLMCTRLGVFENKDLLLKNITQTLSAQETWMNIFHQNKKIGYSQRMIQPQENAYVLTDKSFLQLNTMGVLHELYIKTNAILNKDMSLSQFSFQLTSEPFKFKVQGKIKSNVLRLIIDESETQIPIQEKIYLPTALMDAAYALDLRPGEKQKIQLFDPSTMGMRTVDLFCKGTETLTIQGIDYNCSIYSMEFMGMISTAWIDSNGQIVQEEGLMGMKLKKTSKEQALKGLSGKKLSDLIEWVSIKSNVILKNPVLLDSITFKINASFDPQVLYGGRQTKSDDSNLTIQLERIPSPPFKMEDKHEYIQSSMFILSDHPRIQEQLNKIVKPTDPELVKIKKLMVWMNENIQKRPVLSVPNAIETLNHRRGDCNEHAVLMASFLRAANIPTQIAAGLVYLNGRFYYHAWNLVYLNKWVSLDTIMEQFPADVTHIRLVKGEPDAQMALLGMIGNIDIKILEKKP